MNLHNPWQLEFEAHRDASTRDAAERLLALADLASRRKDAAAFAASCADAAKAVLARCLAADPIPPPPPARPVAPAVAPAVARPAVAAPRDLLAWRAELATLREAATRAAADRLLVLADLAAADVPAFAAACVDAAENVLIRCDANESHLQKLAPFPVAAKRPAAAQPKRGWDADGNPIQPAAPTRARAVREPDPWTLTVYNDRGEVAATSTAKSRSICVSRLANWNGAARGEFVGPDGFVEHLSRGDAMREAAGPRHATAMRFTGTAKARANRAPAAWHGAANVK
jgi:hypothetical protein